MDIGHITDRMQSARVPGLAYVAIDRGSSEAGTLGVRSIETRAPVDVGTVFEAASLSKPIVACTALRLMDAGKLDLDEPLSNIVGPLVADDVGASSITARHVLSHTTGLPNWRRDGIPLRTYFSPGSRFSYSGEGFVFLQAVIERVTGEPLDAVVERLVFTPLGMRGSSFVWHDIFDGNAAFGHHVDGSIEPKFRPKRANAAFSLHTTAVDYGRFVAAVMESALLEEATARLWLCPQSYPPFGGVEDLGGTPSSPAPGIAWGLGWGLEPEGSAFFHWGSNPGATAFVFGVPKTLTALAVFMNSDTGLGMVPRLIADKFPGSHPSLTWLGLPITT
ncbi:serine hydrolase domain-containing protein [Aureimonas sp. AU40]|uniref:serine hydrolase domain-containing protein n=1 Tax=Aureimonas sp. AU40 TaxID=1637747 RepID=UPI000783FC0E|nr:serine hydrolase domain-containing protein [Aureimonas sp. AU40]